MRRMSREQRTAQCPLNRIVDPTVALGPAVPGQPLREHVHDGGHPGWVVAGNELIRGVLTDTRFSSRAELKRAPVHRPGAEPFYGRPTPPGWFIDLDAPDHTRFRRLLARHFTAHRMAGLRPWIERIVRECLDAMAEQGSPVDLISAFALPVPLQSISELLGVPRSERAALKRDSTTVFSLEATAADGAAAMERLHGFFHELIAHKRSRPDDSLVSDLVGSGELSDGEIAGAGVLLLTAGHETVYSMLGLGVLALLSEPAQAVALSGGPDAVDTAVEELLRYLSILHLGVPRGAREDIEIADHTISAGDAVTVALPAGNRDPQRFAEPDRLDLTRNARGHVAFGHGVHQCVGQNLARAELRVAYPALFRRFPGLRLAIAPEDVVLTRAGATYGVYRLPVTL